MLDQEQLPINNPKFHGTEWVDRDKVLLPEERMWRSVILFIFEDAFIDISKKDPKQLSESARAVYNQNRVNRDLSIALLEGHSQAFRNRLSEICEYANVSVSALREFYYKLKAYLALHHEPYQKWENPALHDFQTFDRVMSKKNHKRKARMRHKIRHAMKMNRLCGDISVPQNSV